MALPMLIERGRHCTRNWMALFSCCVRSLDNTLPAAMKWHLVPRTLFWKMQKSVIFRFFGFLSPGIAAMLMAEMVCCTACGEDNITGYSDRGLDLNVYSIRSKKFAMPGFMQLWCSTSHNRGGTKKAELQAWRCKGHIAAVSSLKPQNVKTGSRCKLAAVEQS